MLCRRIKLSHRPSIDILIRAGGRFLGVGERPRGCREIELFVLDSIWFGLAAVTMVGASMFVCLPARGEAAPGREQPPGGWALSVVARGMLSPTMKLQREIGAAASHA